MRTGLLLLMVALLWGCSETGMSQKASMSPKPKDGELALPAGYQGWSKFLSEVQRPDAKQVRSCSSILSGSKRLPVRVFPTAR